MPSSRQTLRQLITHADHVLTVPIYQRRYVWGQCLPGEKDSVSFLLKDILSGYAQGEPFFLQGITIVMKDGQCELVDGQQRLTFLAILLRHLQVRERISIKYPLRPQAEKWINSDSPDYETDESDTQDVFFFKKTLETFVNALGTDIDAEHLSTYLLDSVYFLVIELESESEAIGAFKMMNGTKKPMLASEIIKSDIMRMASDMTQPNVTAWEIAALRARYAAEWEQWVRWWNQREVKDYFPDYGLSPLELLLRLCLHKLDDEHLSYEDFRLMISQGDEQPYHAAKHFFHLLRRTQKRIEEAYADNTAYNRIRAILLLQNRDDRLQFMTSYYVDRAIDSTMLETCYKLSFLGMTYTEIQRGDSAAARFDDLLASLSMADVYHTEAKRDAFNLLLRLNIDEDIKLNRRFDFSIWDNRSLEHIYSKSKVWHIDSRGQICDGNDNALRQSQSQIARDKTYIHRDQIVNHDGARLSEHCIGNLVLLYGQNNSEFGNAEFEEKKMMFLAPGNQGVFKSRNLLHSVCVFAGNAWNSRSIVDNYNLTLKNLKLYYGFK